MTTQDLQLRLKTFAIRAVRLYKYLPKTEEGRIIGKQFLRSSLSAAANYRAACKTQTKKSFVSKLSIAFEEADESLFWLEIMIEAEIMPDARLTQIMQEAKELSAIPGASRKTAAAKSQQS